VHRTGIFTEAQIAAKRKTTTPALFSINHLLRHVPEEKLLFANPEYARWEHTARPVWAHLDAAFGGDDTNALTFAAERKDGLIQVIGFSFRETIKSRLEWVAKKLAELHASRLWIETNTDKGYTADWLRTELAKRRQTSGDARTRVVDYAESMNKHVKITSYVYEHWERIRFDDTMSDAEYLEQVVDYEEGAEPDDAPDSLSSLLRAAIMPKARQTNDLYKW
jgi:hypothetical protein